MERAKKEAAKLRGEMVKDDSDDEKPSGTLYTL